MSLQEYMTSQHHATSSKVDESDDEEVTWLPSRDHNPNPSISKPYPNPNPTPNPNPEFNPNPNPNPNPDPDLDPDQDFAPDTDPDTHPDRNRNHNRNCNCNRNHNRNRNRNCSPNPNRNCNHNRNPHPNSNSNSNPNPNPNEGATVPTPTVFELIAEEQVQQQKDAAKWEQTQKLAHKDWDRDFGHCFPDLMAGIHEEVAAGRSEKIDDSEVSEHEEWEPDAATVHAANYGE